MAGESPEIQLAQDVMTLYRGAELRFFQRLNLREGQVVLDFGCRMGNYTIPVVEIVGKTGRIYALDVDHRAVNEVIARAGKFGLENIVPMKTEGELEVDLPNKSVDVILFFDVIYPMCKNKGIKRYTTLLKEFKRIMRER
ncbi:MAG: methyltransferase domain-containing protein [Candidatus Heimdallarchaeota archaeon]